MFSSAEKGFDLVSLIDDRGSVGHGQHRGETPGRGGLKAGT
jgi:hypothetical protein